MSFQMKRAIRKIAKSACVCEELNQHILVELIFVKNEEMVRINHETRGIDKVTDVLSFPMMDFVDGKVQLEQQDFIDGKNTVYLGDIVIAPDVVKEQADLYGHSYLRELGFLFSHGMFHLLGYDHMDKKSEKIMIGKQENVLSSLRLTR